MNKGGIMKESYFKSLQMIKRCKIKSAKQYREMTRNYLILNIESLKYISCTRNFQQIIKIANEFY
jgi:hypothetical protein